MRSVVVALTLALALAASAASAEIQSLNASQVPMLVAPPSHGVRFLALWSLDCAYCEANLQALARLQHDHPDRIELITVATDSMSASSAINERLHKAGVDSYPARAYADDTPDRLNYLIDPGWGGEMPHVLVIRADGSKRGYSGLLDPVTLRKLQP